MGSSNEGVEFGGSGGWADDQRSTGVDGSLALSFACFGVGTVVLVITLLDTLHIIEK